MSGARLRIKFPHTLHVTGKALLFYFILWESKHYYSCPETLNIFTYYL